MAEPPAGQVRRGSSPSQGDTTRKASPAPTSSLLHAVTLLCTAAALGWWGQGCGV